MHLHCQVYGQGKPLIVLHGLLGSLRNWHPISQKLADHFQVIAADLPNHGRSSHCPHMDYPSMAADIVEIMRAHHLARAHVLGHSMGGKVAMQLALLHPELVDRLIVVDISPRAYSRRFDRVFSALLSLDPHAFQTRKELEDTLAGPVPDLSTRQFLLNNLARDPTGGYRWKIGLHQIHHNYTHLGAALSQGHPFKGPALFLRGEHSDFLVQEDMTLIRRWFPHAQLQAIPRARHLLHTENPDAFLEAVLEFAADPTARRCRGRGNAPESCHGPLASGSTGQTAGDGR
jgi:esterase